MAALEKSNSQLGDRNDNPMIGPRQDAIADVAAAGATYDQAEVNAIRAGVNDILEVLRNHGLIEES